MFNSKRCEDGKKYPFPSVGVAARFALRSSPFRQDFIRSRKIRGFGINFAKESDVCWSEQGPVSRILICAPAPVLHLLMVHDALCLRAWPHVLLWVHLESFEREPPVGAPPWDVKVASGEANPGGFWVASVHVACSSIAAQKMAINSLIQSSKSCRSVRRCASAGKWER